MTHQGEGRAAALFEEELEQIALTGLQRTGVLRTHTSERDTQALFAEEPSRIILATRKNPVLVGRMLITKDVGEIRNSGGVGIIKTNGEVVPM